MTEPCKHAMSEAPPAAPVYVTCGDPMANQVWALYARGWRVECDRCRAAVAGRGGPFLDRRSARTRSREASGVGGIGACRG